MIHLPTVLVCTAMTTFVVATALTLFWLHDRRQAATGWWALAMWLGTAASVAQAAEVNGPLWLGAGMASILTVSTYCCIAAGLSRFAAIPVSRSLLVAGPFLWIFIVSLSVFAAPDLNLRLAAKFTLVGAYSAVIAYIAFLAHRKEPLSSYLVAMIVFAFHALYGLLNIGAVVIWPVDFTGGMARAPWLAPHALETFMLTVFTTFMFTALIKERTERRYRLAAEIDSLTRTSSRRHFVEETRRLLARRPQAGVLAVLDLDYFKSINDTYGHMAGDRVLASFGHLLSTELPPGALYGRLGGEEFGVFLPDMSEPEAEAVLENVRAAVEAMQVVFMGTRLNVTTSAGLACISLAGIDFDHLMAAADNALYLAKGEGRNRLGVFRPAHRIREIVEGGEVSRVSLAKKRVSRLSVRSHRNIVQR